MLSRRSLPDEPVGLGAAMFDDVYVGSASNTAPRDGSSQQEGLRAEVTIDTGQEIRRITPALYGMNIEWIYDGYGLWDAQRQALNERLTVLTRTMGETVSIDGNLVNSGWVQVGSTNKQAARVSVTDGVHVLTGTAPFGVIVIGYDQYDSYGYPGGLNQAIINPMN
jgi:hypothetical protein